MAIARNGRQRTAATGAGLVLAVAAAWVAVVAGQNCLSSISGATVASQARAMLGDASYNWLNLAYWWSPPLTLKDDLFVFDVLTKSSIMPPQRSFTVMGFPLPLLQVPASAGQWADRNTFQLVGGDPTYSWVQVPCESSCPGDVIAGPALYNDNWAMVQQYVPSTWQVLINTVTTLPRVAVVANTSDVDVTRHQVLVPGTLLGQGVVQDTWGFQWFGNASRRAEFLCRRYIRRSKL